MMVASLCCIHTGVHSNSCSNLRQSAISFSH